MNEWSHLNNDARLQPKTKKTMKMTSNHSKPQQQQTKKKVKQFKWLVMVTGCEYRGARTRIEFWLLRKEFGRELKNEWKQNF